MKSLNDIESPGVVIDAERLERNLQVMQAVCDANGVELWPHIKTHKLVPILRRQLELGARGATCAKLGEAEAMLPSGVRRIFIAHSMADFSKATRLKSLSEKLDELILAVTSAVHWERLERILESVNLSVSILLAVDTGLGREGTRDLHSSTELAKKIRTSNWTKLVGIYTHEGHAYGADGPEEVVAQVDHVHAALIEHADVIGGDLPLWPGCSVTAARMATMPRVKVVRPGGYVFGDLALSDGSKVSDFSDNALSILATVVDRPEDGLALIDAGSKVFSGDKTPAGLSGRCVEVPSVVVRRVNEEHGFLAGEGVNQLAPGDRLRFVPAHVCPVVNLASKVYVMSNGELVATWPVDARGRAD